MPDLVHPDSDWATLGSRLLDRSTKPFSRLEIPTPSLIEVQRAKAVLALHRKQQRIKVKRLMGRPKKHPDLKQAAFLREQGLTWESIAEVLGVHRNTLCIKRKEFTKHQT